MDVITYSEARNSLKSVLDRVIDDHAEVIVRRRNGRSVVLISLDAWNSLNEASGLPPPRENAGNLRETITQFDGTTATVFVLNGPNLNLLGTREPAIYGTDTLADIEAKLCAKAAELDLAIDFRQTNHEGVLVDWLHEARTSGAKAVLLNAGAYTHTSIALLDAIKGIELPVIEVHLSDPRSREPFRHLSYVGLAAVDCVQGLGPDSYLVALERAAAL